MLYYFSITIQDGNYFHPIWPQNVMTWDTISGGNKWENFGASIPTSFARCCFW